MKVLAFLAVFAILAALAVNWFVNSQVYGDQGHLIPFACGNPRNGELEIQIAVSFAMTDVDPPRFINSRQEPWSQWLARHLELRDEENEVIRLKRTDFANLVPEAKTGTPELYATAKVQPNATYTLDYFPEGKANSAAYRNTFTTTDEGKPFKQATFTLVGE